MGTKRLGKLAIVALLTLAIAIVAGAAVPGMAAKSWTGKIVIWDAPRWPDAKDNKFHWIQSKIAEFEKSHPGVEIELVQVPWAELGQKLNVAIAGRAWPDVAPIDISGGAVQVTHLEQGVLEPMNDFFTKQDLADFFPGALSAYTYKKKLYGVPTSMTVHALLLNLDIFKERGVEPPKNGKWTWDEFADKMKKLTFDRNGDGKIDVYGFSSYILKGYYEMWPFLYMDGARPLSEDGDKYTFDEPAAISALQKIVDLKFKYKAAPAEMGSADVGGTFQAFANPQQRRIAVEPWASWAIATLRTNQKYNSINFMVAEYPTGKSGEPVTIGGSGGWVVFRQRDKDKLETVVEFVKSLSTAEEQVTFAKNYGTFPARKSAYKADPFKGNPQMQKAAEMLEDAVSVPRVANWTQIDERIQAQLQLALNGEKTPEQALKDAGRDAKEFLK